VISVFRNRRRHAQPILVLGVVAMLIVSCSHPEIDRLKTGVVGTWVDVTDANATLQFNPDGVLVMTSTREKHFCNYDFPDAKHVRLDCAPAGTPRQPRLWTFDLSDDEISIGDGHETGRYHRN
jgi:hypothetical protein